VESVVPSSVVHVADDISQFASSIRPSDTKHTIAAGRGTFAATVARIDLHRLWMQHTQVSHPWIGHAQLTDKRAFILLNAKPEARVIWKGVELSDTDIALGSPGQEYWFNMTGPSQWGSMSLPVEDLATLSAAMVGRDLTPQHNSLAMKATSGSREKLLRLHGVVGRLAQNAPDIIANADAARGLEQVLVEAVFDCIAGSDAYVASATWRQHTAIMKRFRAALEANVEQPVYVLELCQSIGVPARALRLHCQEHLGMGPKKYLLLRRLNLAREALRAADPSTTTVTEIATRFGFWELGRFAVQYRAWCGESPSDSLRRTPA
jgi:AraC-like DNA-binding protein